LVTLSSSKNVFSTFNKWNDLNFLWHDLTWNDLIMERSDRNQKITETLFFGIALDLIKVVIKDVSINHRGVR